MEFRESVRLAPYTSWQVGGDADFLAEPKNEPELEGCIRFASRQKLPITIISGGTNILVSDLGIRGLVVALKRFSRLTSRVVEDRLVIEALAGTSKSELLKLFLKNKLEPALFLAGLPGDIGGGVVMNAGVSEAMTPREFVEITDAIEVWSWNDGGEIYKKRILKEELQWSYRHCNGWQVETSGSSQGPIASLIAKVELSWPYEPRTEVLKQVRDANQVRLSKQPLDQPSCGSVFINPQGTSAGRLIEAAGLKGFRIGGARVSEKHANFIVNSGNACAQDIARIIEHVQSVVKEESGVELKTEVIRLGQF